MSLTPVAWEFLLPEEFERRLAARPIVYLPLGLCEPHGHIAPFGLDTIKARYLCEEGGAPFRRHRRADHGLSDPRDRLSCAVAPAR